MNIHPLVIHFPIAFLVIYSLIVIFPIKRWFPRLAWKDIELILLLVGFTGTIAALQTGEIASELTFQNRDILEMHEFFANATSWTYGLLIAGKILSFIQAHSLYTKIPVVIQKLISPISSLLNNTGVVILLAIIGIIVLSLTGLLGGVMVYGTSADPLAPFVLKLLQINL